MKIKMLDGGFIHISVKGNSFCGEHAQRLRYIAIKKAGYYFNNQNEALIETIREYKKVCKKHNIRGAKP